MKRLVWWIFSVWLVSACTAPAADPISIGVCLPLSGNLGSSGGTVWEGIRAAHEMRPQVLGRAVELKVADTRSDKAEAANAVFRLVEKDRVTAIIGGVVPESIVPGSFHAERRGIPIVTPAGARPKVMCGKGDAPRVCPLDGDQVVHAANFALNSLDAGTAAIVYDMSDEHSIGMAAGFRREFTGAGGRILLQTRMKTGDRDFMGQIIQIRKAKPDIIYAPIGYVECALIAGQARDMGLEATIVTADTAHLPDVAEVGRRPMDNLLSTNYFHDGMFPARAGKRFRDLCTSRTKRPLQAAHVMGADAYLLVLQAIARSRVVEATRVGEALRDVECFEGVTGKTMMKEDGLAPLSPYLSIR